MELLFIKYGALAVFLAAMIEADVVPVLTGVVTRLGYLKVSTALFAATAGAFAGDCLWFFAGVFFAQHPAQQALSPSWPPVRNTRTEVGSLADPSFASGLWHSGLDNDLLGSAAYFSGEVCAG